jgi:hypothetical protein
VLRTIFVPKQDEVTGDWRELHNENLCNLYSSPNITFNNQIEENELDRTRSTHGSREDISAYKF